MRRVVRNPLADTDPYAVPYLTGSSWWDFGLGPLCRRICAEMGWAYEQPTARDARTTTLGDDDCGPHSRAAQSARMADRDATYPAAVPVGTDPADNGMLALEAFGPERRAS